MNITIAQSDVPAHIANEYCNPNRSFSPLPSFDEDSLPRNLIFRNFYVYSEGNQNMSEGVRSWFPLREETSRLGSPLPILRGSGDEATNYFDDRSWVYCIDLQALRHLDKVRTEDLRQSKNNLDQANSQLTL